VFQLNWAQSIKVYQGQRVSAVGRIGLDLLPSCFETPLPFSKMIVNDENIPTNVVRTSGSDGKDVVAPPSAVKRTFGTVVSNNSANIGVSTAVTPKKKLSVRDLAKSFQGGNAVPMPVGIKSTTVTNVDSGMGRYRASSLPGMIHSGVTNTTTSGTGIYPFSHATKVQSTNQPYPSQYQYQRDTTRARAHSQYDVADTAATLTALNGLVSPTNVRTSGNSESGE
jgi:hypothetical protein